MNETKSPVKASLLEDLINQLENIVSVSSSEISSIEDKIIKIHTDRVVQDGIANVAQEIEMPYTFTERMSSLLLKLNRSNERLYNINNDLSKIV